MTIFDHKGPYMTIHDLTLFTYKHRESYKAKCLSVSLREKVSEFVNFTLIELLMQLKTSVWSSSVPWVNHKSILKYTKSRLQALEDLIFKYNYNPGICFNFFYI